NPGTLMTGALPPFDSLPSSPLLTCAPGSNSWTPITTVGAPSPRSGHTAVWTGTEMIVWGGDGTTGFNTTPLGEGSIYDPLQNVWRPMSSVNAPLPRDSHSAVWTGSVMIVWGGETAFTITASGGIYDPVTDTWSSMSAGATPRVGHAAIWTGRRLLVW